MHSVGKKDKPLAFVHRNPIKAKSMKKITLTVIALVAALCVAWQLKPADYEQEVRAAEKSFEKMASEKGIAQAFYAYADDNAVIKRQHDTLVYGKQNIRKYYESQDLKNATVHWTPDFVSVAKSGDMAYTYGKYVWKAQDEKGATKTFSGVFHTVWKKQPNGEWKYVWD